MSEQYLPENLISFERHPESPELYIVFSAAGSKYFDCQRAMADYPVNKLFLKDTKKSWYNNRIPGLSENADDLLDLLKSVTGDFKPENITCMGSSMGGYAALLFGLKMGVRRIVALSPQIRFHEGIPHHPAMPVKYNNLIPMIKANERTGIYVFVGTDNLIDIWQALQVRDTKAHICGISKAPHRILSFWKETECMKDFFDWLICGISTQSLGATPLHAIDFNVLDTAIKRFFLVKDYPKVKKLLLHVLKKWDIPAPYHLMGCIEMNQKQYEKALHYFIISISKGGYNYDTWNNAGICYLKLKNYDDAGTCFRRAIDLHGTPPAKFYINLATALRLSGKNDAAYDAVNKGLELTPDDANGLYQKGMLLMSVRRYNEAVAAFKAILAKTPNRPDVVKLIAECRTSWWQKFKAAAFG